MRHSCGCDRELAACSGVDFEREFVEVARFRLVRPLQDPFNLIGDVSRGLGAIVQRELSARTGTLGAVLTEVVLSTLEDFDANAAHVRGDLRGVLRGELVLEVLGRGRDNDAFARHHGGHEVGQRLTHAGPGFDDVVATFRDGRSDRADHGALALATLAATGQITGNRVEQVQRTLSVISRRSSSSLNPLIGIAFMNGASSSGSKLCTQRP